MAATFSYSGALKTAEAVAPATETAAASTEAKGEVKYAVVDTNAIIKGMRLEQLEAEAVTIPEVLKEVRDGTSRHVLQTLPFGIDVREPQEEAYDVVRRFARLTGDITVLSVVDMKVVALAYTLEKAAHGMVRLRDKPPRPAAVKRKATNGVKLPGWDFVSNPEEWAELDKEDEEAEARLAAAGYTGASTASATASRVAAMVQELRLDGGGSNAFMTDGGDGEGEGAAAAAEEDGGDDDDGGWEKTQSRSARVRQLRKNSRKAQEEAEEAEAQAAAAAAAAAAGASASGEGEGEGEGPSRGEGDDGEASESGSDESDEAAPNDSTVVLVTADFAMQNVALQMGLKLVAPDGMRITRLQRWVLRCHACSAVSRQMERHFCEKCGNATMQRVTLTVDGEGVEHVGVRRRHRLRGTRYSLPAPKGGRYAVNPVLREDQLAMMRRPNRGNKGQVDDDVFACEFTQDKLFERGGHAPTLTNAGKAPVVGVGRNPNERKNRMLNRRR